MGNNSNKDSFNIKIKYEGNKKKDEIIVKKTDTIKEIRNNIYEEIRHKIDEKYILIYKDGQLLDENKTVTDYKISRGVVLTYKSSRKDNEFSVFFCGDEINDDICEKLVTKEDNIYDAFKPLNQYVNSYINAQYGYDLDLIYRGIKLSHGKTFADYNIKQNDKIIVKTDMLLG